MVPRLVGRGKEDCGLEEPIGVGWEAIEGLKRDVPAASCPPRVAPRETLRHLIPYTM